MRKILFTFAALLAFMACSYAQENYQPDFKYGLFSNWSIGIAGDASKTMDFDNFTVGQGLDFGAQLRATKRIANRWNLRYMAGLTGMYKFLDRDQESFDGYLKLTSGVSFNFLKFAYLFADAGVAVDPDAMPSFQDKINSIETGKGITPIGQAGLGFNADFGRNGYNRLFLEVGADCRNHYNPELNQEIPFEWVSNLFANIGYTRCLGITQRDANRLAEIERQNELVERLETENANLKNDIDRCSEDRTNLIETVGKCNSTVERLEKELENCLNQEEQDEECEYYEVYFEKNSYELTDTELAKLECIANSILAEDAKYDVEGYCSASGTEQYNQKLSEKRAQTVKKLLDKFGTAEKIGTVSGNGISNIYENGVSVLNQMVIIRKH